MYYGADYYPEHWCEARWEKDAELMAEAGFNAVRIGEFCWSRMETEDGRYDFEWLDRIFEILEKQGIGILLGVPSRGAPPWLIEKDLSMIRVTKEGHRVSSGGRYYTCLSNFLLRDKARELAKKLAEHFGKNSLLIGWHLDNEYAVGNICYCSLCRKKFQAYLGAKYKNIEDLNRVWGTVFWGNEYNEFSQIDPPQIDPSGGFYPAQYQDWMKFNSENTVSLVNLQVEALRKYSKKPITTNAQGGFYAHTVDYFNFFKNQDIAATINYPLFQCYHALEMDSVRGFKKKNFWVVEQRSSDTNFGNIATTSSAPGMIRLWTYQAISQGADGILYFRWRQCPFAHEQLHHGILENDGSRGRYYKEIAFTGKNLRNLQSHLKGSSVISEVAMLTNYPSRWALDRAPYFGKQYEQIVFSVWNALSKFGINIDVLSSENDLSSCKLVILPALYIITDNLIRNLNNYTKNGGFVFITCGSGLKNENNNVIPGTLHPALRRLCGIEIGESCTEEQRRIKIKGKEFDCSVLCQEIVPKKAQVLAKYNNSYIADAAFTRNGNVFYLGTFPEDSFYSYLFSSLLKEANVQHFDDLPEGITLRKRQNGDKELLFLFNETLEDKIVDIGIEGSELLSKSKIKGPFTIKRKNLVIVETGRSNKELKS